MQLIDIFSTLNTIESTLNPLWIHIESTCIQRMIFISSFLPLNAIERMLNPLWMYNEFS